MPVKSSEVAAPRNYCYFCDALMLERWICWECVDRHQMDFHVGARAVEYRTFIDLPARKSPDAPIPDSVIDYALKNHPYDLRLAVRMTRLKAGMADTDPKTAV
jgi:hypothetical protein